MDRLYKTYGRLLAETDLSFSRYLYDKIDWDNRLIVVKGAKGVGKTTMLLQHILRSFKDKQKALYASLDHIWFANHSVLDLAEYHYTHGGTHLFLDEVHKYKTWQQEIKNIYDSYPDLHIVVTGSSMLRPEESLVGDLSRRHRQYTLEGLSFREYLELEKRLAIPSMTLEQLLSSHERMSADFSAETKMLPLFTEYLHHGYYPFYRESGLSYYKAIQQIVSNIIDTDLPAVEKMEYVTATKMKRLFVLLSQMVPYTLNLTNLGQQIEAPRQAVLRMCHLLQQAGLLNLLYNKKSGLSQLGKPEKLYMENTNLLYAMSAGAEIGTVRETFFVNQLKTSHELLFSGTGDFLVDDTITFEVGGRNKNFDQIKDIPNSYLAVDDTEIGYRNRIPLWMFGLLY